MASPRPCIVVGIDFSPGSRSALACAAKLAERSGMPLQLLHVWNPMQIAGALPGISAAGRWVDELKRELAAELQRWGDEAAPGAIARLEEGAPSRCIADFAKAERARLVVVGRSGGAGLAHVVLGSVSERLLRTSPAPVLVVPKGETTAYEAPKRILVGVDFSSSSREAVEATLALSEQLAVARGVLLVHVAPDEREMWLASGGELARSNPWPYDAEELERWAAGLRGASTVHVDYAVVDGHAEAALVAEAVRSACDWIVVGVQGRTALASFLVGSTTDRVLKLADRPVLAVPVIDGPAFEPSG
jgi:nucleotide-binding universal stress UspA family protein